MKKIRLRIIATHFGIAFVLVVPCRGAVRLNALGQYLTPHGYGGAELVRLNNIFRLPIISNGKAGDLIVDTGAPSSLIFRASLGKLGLTEKETEQNVRGAFGKAREHFGLTNVQSLSMGNCTLMNVPVGVASDNGGRGIFRRYGSSDGLLGLREMIKFGGVLDLGVHLLFVRPAGPSREIALAVKTILEREGYTAVDLALARGHLRTAAEINGWPCHLLVDTGATFTLFDRDAARAAKIGGVRTYAVVQGIGRSSGNLAVSKFPKLRVGPYEIKDPVAAIAALSPEMLGAGTGTEVAGTLGAEYLDQNSAVFDFNSATLYLKAKPTR